jgi:hypothetical protein
LFNFGIVLSFDSLRHIMRLLPQTAINVQTGGLIELATGSSLHVGGAAIRLDGVGVERWKR